MERPVPIINVSNFLLRLDKKNLLIRSYADADYCHGLSFYERYFFSWTQLSRSPPLHFGLMYSTNSNLLFGILDNAQSPATN
jgi:hypothetical protein